MSLGARVRLSMKSTLIIVSPSKSGSGAYLCCFEMMYMPSSGTCWMWGQCAPASLSDTMQWYKPGKRMELCASVWISTDSMHRPKRTLSTAADSGSIGEYVSQQWISRAGFGKSRWHQSPSSIPPSWWEIWGFTSLLICPSGSAMPPQHFSASYKTPWEN